MAALWMAGCEKSDQKTQATAPPQLQAAMQTTPVVPAVDDNGHKRILKTKNFVVTITDDRAEGDVTSDTVKYFAVSRHTGSSIRLIGSTMHTHAPDGTPSRFFGYQFKNGNTTYCVYETGHLIVTRGKSHVVVDEIGTWEE
jgi:Ca2+-binding RTX toxin-like protein